MNRKVIQHFFIIFLVIFQFNSIVYGNDRVDSLRQIAEMQSPGETDQWMFQFAYRNFREDVELSIAVDAHLLGNAILVKDTLFMIKLHRDLGYFKRKNYDHNDAFYHFKVAESLAENFRNFEQRSKVYTDLALWYRDLYVWDKSLDYHAKALKVVRENKLNKSMEASIYNNIGLIYLGIENYESALEYYQRALAIKLQLGDSSGAISTYLNIGVVEKELNNLGTSHYNIERARFLAYKYEKIYLLSKIHSLLGMIFQKLEQFDKAVESYNEALYYAKRNNEQHKLGWIYYYIASVKFQQGKDEETRYYLGQSIKVSDNFEDKMLKAEIYTILYKLFESENSYDSAFNYLEKAKFLEDSIYGKDLTNKMANVQLAIQAEESQKLIEQKEIIIRKNRTLNQLMTVIIVLAVGIIIIVFLNYKNSRKINKYLSEVKEELEDKTELLEGKNEMLLNAEREIKNKNEQLKYNNEELQVKVESRTVELQRANRDLSRALLDLDQFIYKASHDLRGPLATLEGIVNISQIEYEREGRVEHLGKMQETIRLMNNILYTLIEMHDYYQKQPTFDNIQITQEVSEALSLAKSYGDAEDIKVLSDIRDDINWESDSSIFRFIIACMFRSAFNFSVKDNSYVKIKVWEEHEKLNIQFEDNGLGIQDKDMPRVFDVFFRGSPGSGTGLELYSARIAVEKLGGNIQLIKPSDNTIFLIVLPHAK